MNKMATEKRNIEANTLREEISSLRVTVTGLRAGKGVLNDVMNQYRESVLRVIDEQPTLDAVEVVHSRFVNVADFGDGEGCFGYCEKCGSVHHAQSPVALKADYRWCRWCGAKMDGDGNG